MAVNTVFGYLRASILIYVAAAGGGSIRGLDGADLATFAFLTQAFIMISGAFGDRELANRIKDGDIVIDLYRPADIQSWWYARWLGRAGFQALARGIPPMLLGAIAFDVGLPPAWWLWAPFLLSIVLATTVGFAVRFCSSLVTFWLLDNRGLDQMVTLLVSFFGGLLLPISLFPSWLEQVARSLPFASMIQLPAEIYLGIGDPSRVAVALGQQLFWALALIGVGRVLLAAATRRVVIQGG